MSKVSRLINTFIPKNYNLIISLDRAKRKFKGILSLSGELINDKNEVILHSKDLNIRVVKIDNVETTYKFGINDEMHIVVPATTNNARVIYIEYDGIINDSMHGVYPCYYNHDGIDKELIATQFESHHAREAFPCIDEPEAKATFDLSLITEKDIIVLGNMPIKTQVTKENKLHTSFYTTPIMSTYLLAWVYGDLHCKSAITKSNVQVNVWATPAQKNNSLDFALDIATKCIDFYEEYFDTPYPLPKCDHVALPDFSSGAMENWGLITYRESALLADPETTGISSKQYIATVISHELSHQWFGNLVTMKWWDTLWLNESFASFIEYKAIDAIQPKWNIWLLFSTHDCISALRRDCLDEVQPVQIDVSHPDEISTLFDGAIVYAKGARLIKMLQTYIGESAFRNGLKNYFTKNQYKNTDGQDLWKALELASNKQLGDFMNSWILKSGYPVVTIGFEDNNLKLSQKQFFTDPNKFSDKLWPIPLNASDPSLPDILNDKELSIPYSLDKTLRLNVGNSSHFITNYDDRLLSTILDDIKKDKLNTLDRLQFLNEQIMLANGGVSSCAKLVALLDAYKNESKEAVWGIMSLAIGELKKFAEDDKAIEKNLKNLSKTIAEEQFARLGIATLTGESEEDTKLRSIIVGLMIYGENESVIKQSKDIFNNTDINCIDPELRSLIISASVKYPDNNPIIDSLIDIYKNTNSSDLRMDIISGLTSTTDTATVKKLLGLITVNNSIIKKQDILYWLIYLMRNSRSRDMAWQWVRDNWNWIEQTFSGDKSYDYYPRYVASYLTKQHQLEEYTDFFSPMLNNPALKRVITVGINDIKERVERISRDIQSVRDELAKVNRC